MSIKISSAECIPLNIPFSNPRVMRAMQRALTAEERVYVYRIQLDDGTVGYGDETVPHSVEHLVGQNPMALMHDDRSGFGPQVAILDAVGRATGVPVHALLGVRLRSHCPISWWAIDMPAADWVAEAEESLRRGYTSFKMKGRPWFDILEQVAAVGQVVPADYKFDIDFNGFLRNSANAEVLLRELDEHPNVGIYESPFHLFRDINGARLLRERVCKPIVEHFRDEYLEAHCADGFVVYGGGLTSIRRAATLSAAFDKPFWLQLVGAGITTAFAIHMGAVLSHAQLPSITISEVWEHDLLVQRLKVENGYIAVSDEPGLGIEVDETAIKRYRVAPEDPTPTALYRRNKRILRISWPGSGGENRIWDFTNEAIYQPIFYAGDIPGFERGVSLEVIEDDGSAGFGSAHAKLVEIGR